MSKRKLLSILCIIMLTAALLAGCGGSGNEGGGEEANAEAINIGLNYELSGGVASYGQACVDGIEMAIEEINAAGGILDGKQINLVKVDNKSDAAEATSVATRLCEEGVVAMLGPATSGLTKACTPVVTENGIPLVSTSATADDVTVKADGSVNEYIFRICYNDSFQGTAMANYALKTLEAKKAIILKDNSSDYSLGLEKNFVPTFEAGGGEIVGGEFAFVAKETDFNAILTKIKGIEADVIYLPAYYEEAGLIIKQARELGITLPILGADGYDSPTLLELAGEDALNAVFFSNHYSSQDTDPLVVKFQEDFNAKYGVAPNAFNALGYDLGYFIVNAIQNADSSDPEAIKDALASTVDFKGVTGILSVDENHNPVKAITVLELINGEQTFNQKIEP